MPKPKHRYRVSVYLGKENYEKLEGLAIGLNVFELSRTTLLSNAEGTRTAYQFVFELSRTTLLSNLKLFPPY